MSDIPDNEPDLTQGSYKMQDAQKLIDNDKNCRIEAVKVQQKISQNFIAGKGIQKFRDLQRDLMLYGDVLVAGGVMSYDKLIEKTMQLEEHIGKKGGGGGGADADLDPSEKLRKWLSGEPVPMQ